MIKRVFIPRPLRPAAVLLLSILSAGTIGFFLVSFYYVFHSPLYIDDPMWLIQNARLPYDGFRMINLFPMCRSNFTWEVPWVMWPGRLFAAALHPDSYITLRLIGMGKYLLCIAVMSAVVWLHFRPVAPLLVLIGGVAAFLSFGILPLLMVFTRPETGMFIGCGLLYLLMTASRRTERPKYQYILAGLFVLVLSWFLSLHPKSQFFLPAVLLMACGIRLPRRHLRLLFVLLIVYMGFQDYRLWKVHPTCPSWPMTMYILSNHTLVPKTFKQDPERFFRIMFSNLSKAKKFYVDSALFQRRYWVNQGGLAWFSPPRVRMEYHDLANRLIKYNFLLFAMFAFVGLLSATNRHGILVLFRPCPAAVAFWLAVALGMQIAIKRSSTFYETAMIWPIGLMVAVLLIAQEGWQEKYRRTAWGMLAFMMVTAMVSHWGFVSQLRPYLIKMGDSEQYHNGFIAAGRVSVHQAIFDYPEREKRIVRAAEQCAIPRDQSARHVVIDEYTYLPFRKTFQPFYGTYLYLWGPRGRSLLGLLRRRGSTGLVSLCRILPYTLRQKATDVEGICCINFDELWDKMDNQNIAKEEK